MKIRNGFVSNSSSSSFIIIGQKINLYNISVDDIENKNIYIKGSFLCEGYDFFKLTYPIWNYILENNINSKFSCYEVQKIIDNEEEKGEENLVNKNDINFDKAGNIFIETIEVDYFPNKELDDFKHQYGSDELRD